ncbi:MAG TPA: formimidoylglutamase [Flavobacterium sp.]|nr:formimidoylglutamase [Flavobacterium sp.]
MIDFEFLQPLSQALIDEIQQKSSFSIGGQTVFHSAGHFPDIENKDIAIITVDNPDKHCSNPDFDAIRKEFYALYPGNWSKSIVDLGHILSGDTPDDTYYLIKKITTELVKRNIVPIYIGASQDTTYGIYRGFDELEQQVSLATIDSKIDVVADYNNLSESFVARIILEEPTNLINYVNLGYQTYFNSQEEIDLIHRMQFDAYRLGEIVQDIKIAEPLMRNTDIVSLDMQAVQGSFVGNADFQPNGFDGREVCALARYAGYSDQLKSFGIFNMHKKNANHLLLSQIIWYFIEGFNYRLYEYPFSSKEDYYKYVVPLEEQELIFYKSNLSERWWISGLDYQNKENLYPCHYSDYQQALSRQIPEIWWKINQK